jgi:ribosomal-protein-alanine N-acetyltransferase
MNTIIRQVKKHEIQDVYNLEKNVFQPINYPLFVLRQFYDLMPDLFLVAVDEENEIIGYTQGGINIDKKEGWILSLATNQNSRGKGIGRLLSQKVIELFRSKRIDRILLTVHPGNLPATHLYKKMGFEVHEKIENYYGDGELRLVMELK